MPLAFFPAYPQKSKVISGMMVSLLYCSLSQKAIIEPVLLPPLFSFKDSLSKKSIENECNDFPFTTIIHLMSKSNKVHSVFLHALILKAIVNWC